MKYAFIEAVLIKAATDKALLCTVGTEDIWIPRSQLHDDCELSEKDDEGDLIIPKWLAAKNDIEPDGEYEE